MTIVQIYLSNKANKPFGHTKNLFLISGLVLAAAAHAQS